MRHAKRKIGLPVPSEAPAFYEWDDSIWYYSRKWGYYNNSSGALLHRSIYAKAYGPIPPGYEINHKNRIPWDTRLENLEILTAAAHRKLTWEQRRNRPGTAVTKERTKERNLVCPVCGISFKTWHWKKIYCTRACSMEGNRRNKDAERRRRRAGE